MNILSLHSSSAKMESPVAWTFEKVGSFVTITTLGGTYLRIARVGLSFVCMLFSGIKKG